MVKENNINDINDNILITYVILFIIFRRRITNITLNNFFTMI